jgi:hypothetical protein
VATPHFGTPAALLEHLFNPISIEIGLEARYLNPRGQANIFMAYLISAVYETIIYANVMLLTVSPS